MGVLFESLYSKFLKRVLDCVLAVLLAVPLLFPMGLIAIAIRLTSPGPAIFWSERVGRNNQNFRMPKFRTMRADTPQIATHLLTDARARLTPIGSILRKTSMDELPQIWSILLGDMSFVGPRPALFNQHDLISLRGESGVSALVPGLTGWAQINGRDELTIEEKVRLDEQYLLSQSLFLDLKILTMTLYKVFVVSTIRH